MELYSEVHGASSSGHPDDPRGSFGVVRRETIHGYLSVDIWWVHITMAMDQYLLIPFLVGWTSINPSYFDVNYRGFSGFDTLPYGYGTAQFTPFSSHQNSLGFIMIHPFGLAWLGPWLSQGEALRHHPAVSARSGDGRMPSSNALCGTWIGSLQALLRAHTWRSWVRRKGFRGLYVCLLPSGYVKIAIEHDHRNSGFSHLKWWFSIVMLVYQRVYLLFIWYNMMYILHN